MGRAAVGWTPGAILDPSIQEVFSHYIAIRAEFFVKFQHRQRILM